MNASLSALPFEKGESLGNDFVLIQEASLPLKFTDDFLSDLSIALAHRRLGVGCDQVIVLSPPLPNTPPFLRFFNADGSESSACGNGTRYVASLLMKAQEKPELTLQTKAGIHVCRLSKEGHTAVDMTLPRFSWQEIPLSHNIAWDSLPLTLEDELKPLHDRGYSVNIGNPHLVFFVEDIELIPLERVGKAFESNPLFPQKTNVGFAQILSPNHLRLRVWERGSGATLACGTGACAAAAIAQRLGLTTNCLTVEQKGGSCIVEAEESHFWLEGPTTHCFSGIFRKQDFSR